MREREREKEREEGERVKERETKREREVRLRSSELCMAKAAAHNVRIRLTKKRKKKKKGGNDLLRPGELHGKDYGVAMVSRLLKIIGLFCKRALQKRLYSAKETYTLKEPTTCSHPIKPTTCEILSHSKEVEEIQFCSNKKRGEKENREKGWLKTSELDRGPL